MPKRKANEARILSDDLGPDVNPEVDEARMINLAVRRAEEQLRDGTASAQVIVHYLKLGTAREKKELEILEKQSQLLEAKKQALDSAKHIEELYAEAINAMKIYAYNPEESDDEDEKLL